MEPTIVQTEQTLFNGNSFKWVLTSEGRKAVRAAEVVEALGKQVKDTSRLLQLNVFPDYRFQSSFGEAKRPAWYLYEHGAVQLATKIDSPEAEPLQRWIFDTVVKLFTSGIATARLASETEAEFADRTEIVEEVNQDWKYWKEKTALMTSLANGLTIQDMLRWMCQTYHLDIRPHHLRKLRKILKEEIGIQMKASGDATAFWADGNIYAHRLIWLPQLILERVFPIYPETCKDNIKGNKEEKQKYLKIIQDLQDLPIQKFRDRI